jgi:hypothetical protein
LAATGTTTANASARPQRTPAVRTAALLGQPAANAPSGRRRSGQR